MKKQNKLNLLLLAFVCSLSTLSYGMDSAHANTSMFANAQKKITTTFKSKPVKAVWALAKITGGLTNIARSFIIWHQNLSNYKNLATFLTGDQNNSYIEKFSTINTFWTCPLIGSALVYNGFKELKKLAPKIKINIEN